MFWSNAYHSSFFQRGHPLLESRHQNEMTRLHVVPSLPQIFKTSFTPDYQPVTNFDTNYLRAPPQNTGVCSPAQVVPSSPSNNYWSDSEIMFATASDNSNNLMEPPYLGQHHSPTLRQSRLSSLDSMEESTFSPSSSIHESFSEYIEMRPKQIQSGSISSQQEINADDFHENYDKVLPSDCSLFSQSMLTHDTKFYQEMMTSQFSPLYSLAMEHVTTTIEKTCRLLNIARDPSLWTRDEVIRWMEWTMQQFNVSPSAPNQQPHQWVSDGQELVQLTLADFKEKMPQGGENVYGHLEFWRTSSSSSRQGDQVQNEYQNPAQRGSSISPTSTSTSGLVPVHQPPPYFPVMEMGESNEQHHHYNTQHSAQLNEGIKPVHLISTMSNLDYAQSQPMETYTMPSQNETSSLSPDGQHHHQHQISNAAHSTYHQPTRIQAPHTPHTPRTPPTPSLAGRTNIPLWQFIKELLDDPQNYSNYLHWLDREKGTFKIVDSAHLAQLWGRRKNRPAMNYDKMSRSIRQYYKKGIMKKPDRPQRLVYQYCSPFHC